MAGRQPLPGWTLGRDTDNGDSLDVAKWAVKEYNLHTGNNLEFVSESSYGKMELPDIIATIWKIDLQATDSTTLNSYRTYVWQKLQGSDTHNQLVYFGITSTTGT